MGLHPQGARRIAMGAVLAAVVSCALVGTGVGVGTAQEGAVPAAPLIESVPTLPAREAAVAPPTSEPTVQPVPEASEAAPPETGTDAGTGTEPESTPDDPAGSTTPEAAAPSRATVPLRSTAAAPLLVAGTPCTTAAKACVDLAGRSAWLIENGTVRRGPVHISIGDEIDPTPLGTFQVEWKAEQWTSREYLTQMPYSVFFAEGGIAFHEGQQETPSAGCVKLGHADAMAWFEYLQVGDEVQVR